MEPEIRNGEVFVESDEYPHYEGTVLDLVPASYTFEDDEKFALGIVDVFDGEGFGHYAECGVVHTQ